MGADMAEEFRKKKEFAHSQLVTNVRVRVHHPDRRASVGVARFERNDERDMNGFIRTRV